MTPNSVQENENYLEMSDTFCNKNDERKIGLFDQSYIPEDKCQFSSLFFSKKKVQKRKNEKILINLDPKPSKELEKVEECSKLLNEEKSPCLTTLEKNITSKKGKSHYIEKQLWKLLNEGGIGLYVSVLNKYCFQNSFLKPNGDNDLSILSFFNPNEPFLAKRHHFQSISENLTFQNIFEKNIRKKNKRVKTNTPSKNCKNNENILDSLNKETNKPKFEDLNTIQNQSIKNSMTKYSDTFIKKEDSMIFPIDIKKDLKPLVKMIYKVLKGETPNSTWYENLKESHKNCFFVLLLRYEIFLERWKTHLKKSFTFPEYRLIKSDKVKKKYMYINKLIEFFIYKKLKILKNKKLKIESFFECFEFTNLKIKEKDRHIFFDYLKSLKIHLKKKNLNEYFFSFKSKSNISKNNKKIIVNIISKLKEKNDFFMQVKKEYFTDNGKLSKKIKNYMLKEISKASGKLVSSIDLKKYTYNNYTFSSSEKINFNFINFLISKEKLLKLFSELKKKLLI